MSAYKNALHLFSAEQGPRLQLAAEMLAEKRAVVVLDGALALRPDSGKILCEVISSGSIAPQTQAEEAKRLLRASTFGSFVDWDRCQWLVVEDYGTGTVELWRES
jgi:hypothetical protein